MLKKSFRLGKIFLSLLSLSLFSSMALGFDNYGKLSYLDSVADSYLYDQSSGDGLLNINSPDAQTIEARVEIGSEPYPRITNNNEKVSISLAEADLMQVLRMLCEKAGLSFAPMADDIREKSVTLDLSDVPLNDAMILVMKMSDLLYKVENNTLMVYPKKDNNDSKTPTSFSNISVVPVKYANVNTVAQFLNSNIFANGIFGLSNHAVVSPNPAKNELFVFGTDADLVAIKKVLPLIDTKPMVNTFKVNHVTPKEMAGLVCESLFNAKFDDSDQNTEKTDYITIGGGSIACRTDDTNNTEAKRSIRGNNDNSIIPFDSPPLTIAYFSESGKIGAYGGSVQQAALIRDFIKEHDKKQLMAYVEISVIELNEEGSKQFSNTWNLWTPFISLGFDRTAFTVGGANNPFWIWGDHVTDPDGTSLTKTNNSALIYQLNYIVQNKNGRVLSNPKIMVTNGRKATIDMTSDYVKKVTTQILESSTSITSGSQRTYDIGSDEGIMIELIPFISPDGYVTMNLTPEFSTIKDTVTRVNEQGGEDIEATLLQRRDLELKNVRVRDGESLVLAGLIKENETQNVSKVPLLGDLPFVGSFFRSSSTNKTREEMVIVVTPHIIKDSDEAKDEMVYDL